MLTPESSKKAAMLVLGAALLAVLILSFVPVDRMKAIAAEGGPIENLSLVVLAFGTVAAGLRLWRARTRLWAAVTVMLFWMFLRELDYQKLFTPRSIESIGFYSNPQVPLQWKLAAIAALLPFGIAALHLLLTTARHLRSRPGVLWTWRYPIGAAVILMIVATTAEKVLSPRFLFVEETGELAFAALVVVLVLQAVSGSGRTATDPSPPTSPASKTSSPPNTLKVNESR
ncbi:MAG TPA: hypothetical protein GYA07_04815 [Verrucomicrobia bacterium]|nr:hypothetical protein [Verrucomicrobiota bacterium]HOP96403.1 hypothetical protein [Verrucomicrobiota bacterium]HPU57349.1 hypothetical protein [Verrucomicrobiota bacterium]